MSRSILSKGFNSISLCLPFQKPVMLLNLSFCLCVLFADSKNRKSIEEIVDSFKLRRPELVLILVYMYMHIYILKIRHSPSVGDLVSP